MILLLSDPRGPGGADLDTDHGVHVDPRQVPRLDHRDADLVVLGGQAARHLPCLPTRAKKCQYF